MSWIPVANRRQANVVSSGNPLPDETDSPLNRESITKGRTQINSVYGSSCNEISFVSSTLNSTLALYHSRLPKHLNNKEHESNSIPQVYITGGIKH